MRVEEDIHVMLYEPSFALYKSNVRMTHLLFVVLQIPIIPIGFCMKVYCVGMVVSITNLVCNDAPPAQID